MCIRDSVVTVMLSEQAGDVKVLLRNAAITVTPQKVTADSPAVTALVGEPAARIAPSAAPAASGGGRQGGCLLYTSDAADEL